REIAALIQPARTPEEAWHLLTKKLLSSTLPFSIHLLLFSTLFPHWHIEPEKAPASIPTKNDIQSANISQFQEEWHLPAGKAFHAYTVNHFEEFWERIVRQLNIVFK